VQTAGGLHEHPEVCAALLNRATRPRNRTAREPAEPAEPVAHSSDQAGRMGHSSGLTERESRSSGHTGRESRSSDGAEREGRSSGPTGREAHSSSPPNESVGYGRTGCEGVRSCSFGVVIAAPNWGCWADLRRTRPLVPTVTPVAKGFNRVVVATVVVTAFVAAGQAGSRAGDDPPSTSGGSSVSAPRDRVAPPAPPVPGQREKDQDAAPVALVADPVGDECVLNAAQVTALIGEPADRTAMTSIPGADGRSARGCVAFRGENQLVLMNVYRVRDAGPADAVRDGPAEGRRFLDGVGEDAAVVDSRVGPILQVAGRRFLVTIAVAGHVPSDDAWRTAGKAALDRVG
jgi:hypothetical protein